MFSNHSRYAEISCPVQRQRKRELSVALFPWFSRNHLSLIGFLPKWHTKEQRNVLEFSFLLFKKENGLMDEEEVLFSIGKRNEQQRNVNRFKRQEPTGCFVSSNGNYSHNFLFRYALSVKVTLFIFTLLTGLQTFCSQRQQWSNRWDWNWYRSQTQFWVWHWTSEYSYL